MMTGEYDFNDIFKNHTEQNMYGVGGSPFMPMSTVTDFEYMFRFVFFTFFLFGIPIGLFNLLTGFALEKVHVSVISLHFYFVYPTLHNCFNHTFVIITSTF